MFRERIGALFSDDAGVAGALSSYLLIASWGFFGYGLLVVGNGALNAIDRAGLGFRLSVARVLLVMLPLAWIGTRTGGASLVYAAELAANLIGGAAAFWLVRRTLGEAEPAGAATRRERTAAADGGGADGGGAEPRNAEARP